VSAILELPTRLQIFCQRFKDGFRTKTRDTGHYVFPYLSGLLRLNNDKTMTNIAREAEIPSQNMQQFLSDSPWSEQNPIVQVQDEISARPEFQKGSVLIIDESADKSGQHKAGSSRQHNGNLGKIEQSQVGVFAGLVNNGHHCWIDGQLYLPEAWFSEKFAQARQKVGLPEQVVFQTKIQIAAELIKNAHRQGVPFEAVDFDTLYGRNSWLRDELDKEQIEYYGDVPSNSTVFLERPLIHWPVTKKGVRAKKPRVIGLSYQVQQLVYKVERWHTITIRPNERGHLIADFARFRVWTVREDGSLREEWLLIRREHEKEDYTYTLSNAPTDCPLEVMAERKCQRYFIERSNQDSKSEIGWADFRGIKYRGWLHHLAFTIMASWFVLETKLDWEQQFSRDPTLIEVYETDVLPKLSVANVRTLLQAAMPLRQLSPEQAIELVIEHLDNRTKSRKSRLKTRFRR